MTDHQQARAKQIMERMKFDLACNDTTGLLALCEAAVLLDDAYQCRVSEGGDREYRLLVSEAAGHGIPVVARYGKEGETSGRERLD